jgi:hypothetical protein
VCVKDSRPAGEEKALDVMQDRVHAWWTAVLAGQADQSHPVHGTDVKARVEGNTLVISGHVASEADRDEIKREADHLKGHGIKRVRDELRVTGGETEERGLLTQTLIGVFETEEQAGFAAGYLEGHAHVATESLQVILPGDTGAGLRVLHALVPETYWPECQKALAAGHALLVVTVDEVDAFKVRELLEEETQSLRTLVLPPEPGHTAQRTGRARQSAERSTGGRRIPERADHARRRSLDQEKATHDA